MKRYTLDIRALAECSIGGWVKWEDVEELNKKELEICHQNQTLRAKLYRLEKQMKGGDYKST